MKILLALKTESPVPIQNVWLLAGLFEQRVNYGICSDTYSIYNQIIEFILIDFLQ